MGLLNIVMALTVLQVSVNCNDPKFHENIEPVEEVVSIYGEDFETPESREPYFIKVYRCVATPESSYCTGWPSPSSKYEIEIVVADINTKFNKAKFYKYIVYNHTACQFCSQSEEKLHNHTLSGEVNEAEFKAKVLNNPINLRNCNTFCDEAQPRHKANPNINDGVYPEHKYILYHQCFPGCKSNTTNTTLTGSYLYSGSYGISVYFDNACSPYGVNASPQPQKLEHTVTREDANRPEKESGLLISIASPKVFLAAFVLSVMLVAILIVDFSLCHRQKGMIYAVFNCGKDNNDNTCPACAHRQQKVNEIV